MSSVLARSPIMPRWLIAHSCFLGLAVSVSIPVWPQTPAPCAQPAPQMQRLIETLAGQWSIQQTFEPRAGMPKGGMGQGTEVWRPGPGARSLIEDLHTTLGDRELAGLGIIWWETRAQGYQVIW